MFSQELQKLDQNTVQYMIDIMQDTIDAQKEQLDQKDKQLEEKDNLLREQATKTQQEITQGILNAINIMQELNVPEKEIIEKLQDKYLLTPEQAKKYMKK